MKRQSSQPQPARRHLTLEEKAQILEAQQQSGLSLLAFAAKHGLCYSSLLRWRWRQDNGPKTMAAPDRPAGPGFVPVHLEGDSPGEQYVLSWPSGRSLKVPQYFEMDSLRRLLSVLEETR